MSNNRYISEKVRRLVAERADYLCEYCKMPSLISFFTFQIDHIISLRHGGSSHENNLAFCCPICNTNKGSDIATVLDNSLQPIRFFNPRVDIWNMYFLVDKMGEILPHFNIANDSTKNKIAEATIKIFDFNHPDSIIERIELINIGFFEEGF